MRENKKLYSLCLKELRQDTFYRQRFDACPHFMSFIGEAHTSVTNHSKYPYGQNSAYCKFVKDRADWYHSNSQLKNTAFALLKLLKNNPKTIVEIRNDIKPKIAYFYKCCRDISSINLNKLSDAKLIDEYVKFKNAYFGKLYISALIDGFSLVTDEIIHEKIKAELNYKKDLNKIFEKLTACAFISFLQEEEKELLMAKKKILAHPDQKKNIVAKHRNKFFWIQNNYVDDNVLSFDFFEKRLADITGVSLKIP